MTSIPSWARKGARVVYVGPAGASGPLDPDDEGIAIPTIGAVYTIEYVEVDPEGIYIAVAEVPGTETYIELLRPVAKTEQEDVAKFSHHLTQRQPEGLDA